MDAKFKVTRTGQGTWKVGGGVGGQKLGVGD
jgi:hypothetical protein